jgi:hypothetical protein
MDQRNRNGKRKKAGSQLSRPGLGKRIYNFITLVENLPYGASLMQEKKVSRVAMGVGILIMAFGGVIFSVGWKWKITWVVETAFIISLIGWMMVILGFAFGVIGVAAKYVPVKGNKA